MAMFQSDSLHSNEGSSYVDSYPFIIFIRLMLTIGLCVFGRYVKGW